MATLDLYVQFKVEIQTMSIYTMEEVRANNGQNGRPVWMIIKGKVYNVSEFIFKHPGGGVLLLEYAGKDATKAFNQAGHSADAMKDLLKYEIGTVEVSKTEDISKIKSNKEKKKVKLFFCF
ncbi:hypothetical protein ACFFRR_010247 [Megaselia abdita]